MQRPHHWTPPMNLFEKLYLRFSSPQIRFFASAPFVVVAALAIVALTLYPVLDCDNTKFQAGADAAKQVRLQTAPATPPTEGSQVVSH
jgi:hypothetical protein